MPGEPAQRLIRGPILYAARSAPVFAKVRTSRLSPTQAQGIRYENQVQRALGNLGKTLSAKVELNPWFKFQDSIGIGACSPDVLFWLNNELTIIEIKYTWVPTATPKLSGLYIPVIGAALNPTTIRSLVICKNLTPNSPFPIENLSRTREGSVYQWRNQGPLTW